MQQRGATALPHPPPHPAACSAQPCARCSTPTALSVPSACHQLQHAACRLPPLHTGQQFGEYQAAAPSRPPLASRHSCCCRQPSPSTSSRENQQSHGATAQERGDGSHLDPRARQPQSISTSESSPGNSPQGGPSSCRQAATRGATYSSARHSGSSDSSRRSGMDATSPQPIPHRRLLPSHYSRHTPHPPGSRPRSRRQRHPAVPRRHTSSPHTAGRQRRRGRWDTS